MTEMDEPEHNSLTDSIEDGSYYVAAHRWYSDIFHAPIAERSYYIIVLLLACLNVYYSGSAFMSMFPLNAPAAFNISVGDIWTEYPRIQKLARSSSEDKNVALMRYLIENYITNRESYDLRSYEFRYRNIWSTSSAQVFDTYKTLVDPSNPLSLYHQYTDLANRTVEIVSMDYDRKPEIAHAHVVFRTHVTSVVTMRELRQAKWEADLSYKYTDFKVDQKLNTHNSIAALLGLTGKGAKGSGEKRGVTPMTFMVTDYQVKEMLE